jgi:hypothetical protein
MNFSLSEVWSLYALQSVCTAFDAAAGFAEDDFGDMTVATWNAVQSKAFPTHNQTTLIPEKFNHDSPQT